tara:strand:+ start:149 stop:616 length:468 start_codon:yes stop_codon:yes gene_type:complete
MKSLFFSLLVVLNLGVHAADNYKRDIVEIAVDTPELSTLVTAVQVANLVDTLQSPGPFTVFAPTNTAFANLPDGVLDDLLANPSALRDVLLYHVASGKKNSRTLSRLTRLETVLGEDVTIEERKDGLYINDSKVIISDIKASNGIIHVINAVLIP